MSKIVSISEILAAKERKPKKPQTTSVYVPALDGDLELKKLPLSRFFDLTMGINESSEGSEIIQAEVNLIYEHAPILHNPELLEAYECVIPTDIVLKVFDEDLDTIAKAVTAISSLYSGDRMEDSIKN